VIGIFYNPLPSLAVLLPHLWRRPLVDLPVSADSLILATLVGADSPSQGCFGPCLGRQIRYFYAISVVVHYHYTVTIYCIIVAHVFQLFSQSYTGVLLFQYLSALLRQISCLSAKKKKWEIILTLPPHSTVHASISTEKTPPSVVTAAAFWRYQSFRRLWLQKLTSDSSSS
jgi:hypothetical protein